MNYKTLILFFLFTVLSFCSEMTSEQVKTLTGKDVYSRSKTIELFKITSITLKEKCSSQDALNYMINEGFANFFTKSFYLKKEVDICVLLLIIIDCPNSIDTATSISYYKSFLYNCRINSLP